MSKIGSSCMYPPQMELQAGFGADIGAVFQPNEKSPNWTIGKLPSHYNQEIGLFQTKQPESSVQAQMMIFRRPRLDHG